MRNPRIITLSLVILLCLTLVPAVSGAPLGAGATNSTTFEVDGSGRPGPGIKQSLIWMDTMQVDNVELTVKFEKIDDDGFVPTCTPQGGPGHQGGDAYNAEISIVLISPAGTVVDLIYNDDLGTGTGTYTSDAYSGGAVTIHFSDTAATSVAGAVPESGEFRPEEPLSSFNGENAKGNWALIVGDNYKEDPLCFYSWSLVINGGSNPYSQIVVPEDRDYSRCKLTYIDENIYLGSTTFVAEGLGKPLMLRFMTAEENNLAGYLMISSTGFLDGRWHLETTTMDASGLPLFATGDYEVSCFGPGGTSGEPLDVTISH